MQEQLPHLLAIAILTLVAVTMGLVMVRLKQPPMVGYILAGVLLGPTVVGFVPRAEAVPLLAELGVLFLLFLWRMRRWPVSRRPTAGARWPRPAA